MGLVVLGLVTGALWIGVVDKVVQVWRAPEDLPLRAVAASVACIATAFTLSLPPMRAALSGAGTGLDKLLVNLCTMAAAYWLLAFFMYAVRGARARRAMRLQLVPFAVAVAMVVVSWLLAPAAVRAGPADPANGADGHATVFVLAAVGYMAYAQRLTLRWSVSYARAAGQARLRRGLKVICFALVTLLGGCVTKATLAVASAATVNDPAVVRALNLANVILVTVGTLAFVVGFTYIGVAGMVAALPVWRRHHRHYRELEPLWRALHHAFPDLTLSRVPPARWRDLLAVLRTHRSFYRRLVEIRDGLVQLGPYYDGEVAERAEAEARLAGQSGAGLAMAVQASLLVHALRLKAARTPATTPHPIPVAGGNDLDSDAQWLVRLSRSMTAATVGPPSASRDRSARV